MLQFAKTFQPIWAHWRNYKSSSDVSYYSSKAEAITSRRITVENLQITLSTWYGPQFLDTSCLEPHSDCRTKIDVSGGDKIPRKGGPGISQSDLLVINKVRPVTCFTVS